MAWHLSKSDGEGMESGIVLHPPEEISNEKEVRFVFNLSVDNLSYIGLLSEETWNVSEHYHDHFELCYVSEGEGWFAIGDHFYQAKEGDLFLTKPREVHQGAASGDLPFSLYYLGFQLEHLRVLEVDYYEIGINRVAKDEKGLVKEICDFILEEIGSKNIHSDIMIHGYFLQLLASVSRNYRKLVLEKKDSPLILTPAIRQVLAEIHDIHRCIPDISELAAMVHLSRPHLDREFKRSLGITLGRYIRSIRIDKSKYLLRTTNDSVNTISEKLQFKSVIHFSIFFKRHLGISPQQYRNRK